jgi:hypothetical protein
MSPTILPADNGRGGASPRNAYGAATNATVRLIERRARAYRDIVAAVSLLGLTAIGWALWWRSVQPLALLLLLVPLTLLCLWQDRWLLNGWRACLLADWKVGVVDFAALRGALLANPTLPKTTVAAMLDSLPDHGNFRHERTISLPTREAVALAIMNSDREHAVGLALVGLAAVPASAGSLLAVLLTKWWPLIGLLFAIPIWACGVRSVSSRAPQPP